MERVFSPGVHRSPSAHLKCPSVDTRESSLLMGSRWVIDSDRLDHKGANARGVNLLDGLPAVVPLKLSAHHMEHATRSFHHRLHVLLHRQSTIKMEPKIFEGLDFLDGDAVDDERFRVSRTHRTDADEVQFGDFPPTTPRLKSSPPSSDTGSTYDVDDQGDNQGHDQNVRQNKELVEVDDDNIEMVVDDNNLK